MIPKCVCRNKHPTQKGIHMLWAKYTKEENRIMKIMIRGQNCFRDKGTRKQTAETPKLTPMDKSTSQNCFSEGGLGKRHLSHRVTSPEDSGSEDHAPLGVGAGRKGTPVCSLERPASARTSSKSFPNGLDAIPIPGITRGKMRRRFASAMFYAPTYRALCSCRATRRSHCGR